MSDITPIQGEGLKEAPENQTPSATSPTGTVVLPTWLVPWLAVLGALATSWMGFELYDFTARAWHPERVPAFLLSLLATLGVVSPGWRKHGPKVVALLLLPVLGTGCVNFRPPPPSRVASLAPEAAPFEFQPPPECKTYDRDRKVWGALGRSAALGSGAAGLTSLVTENDSGGLRRGFGLASLALGIFAAGASWYADQQAADYVSRCTQQ